jgi:very-short-patch-repair endonuclease
LHFVFAFVFCLSIPSLKKEGPFFPNGKNGGGCTIYPMPRKQINNKPELKAQRRRLRNIGTNAEAVLWLMLKGKQLERKFRRQHSVGYYILDFYCPAEKLAVELDGDPHFTDEGMKHDAARTAYINGLGIKIIRFENFRVLENPEGVVEEITRCFSKGVQPPRIIVLTDNDRPSL